jgi:hypothetical protein
MGSLLNSLMESLGPFHAPLKIILGMSWVPFLINKPLVGLLLSVVTGTLGGVCAHRKGRNVFAWGVLTSVFWGVGMIILACVRPHTEQDRKKNSQVIQRAAVAGTGPKRGTQKGGQVIL